MNCPTILYSFNMWLKPVSATEVNINLPLGENLVLTGYYNLLLHKYKYGVDQGHYIIERGTWRIDWVPGCLISHPYDQCSNPADSTWGLQGNIIVSPLSMWVGDHVNGGLVETSVSTITLTSLSSSIAVCDFFFNRANMLNHCYWNEMIV